jgi:hypothetical protein
MRLATSPNGDAEALASIEGCRARKRMSHYFGIDFR